MAAREYRDRLAQLRDRIEELEAAGDLEQAAEAGAERDWLVAELGATTGLGGRPRAFPNGEERARIAVGKAIRRAILRIGAADGLIGDHLRRTVHTGVRCCYWPG